MTTLTRLIWKQPTGSGRRTGWARTVRNIDMQQRGAKAFLGEYLRDGVETELAVGTLVVEVAPIGSVKNGFDGARICRVTADGELAPCACSTDGYWDWRKHWLSIRDAVIEELTQDRAAAARAAAGDPPVPATQEPQAVSTAAKPIVIPETHEDPNGQYLTLRRPDGDQLTWNGQDAGFCHPIARFTRMMDAQSFANFYGYRLFGVG